MNESMEAAAAPQVPSPVPALLVRHLAPSQPGARRAPVQVRLEEALGPELAERLVASLVPAPRRRA